ncbi:hypothetical protein AB0912_20485 [Streptomyces sp. NPDC007084]|uniref:hypothetical protein n=1 Tax=Streptomyces sp. NPDC007084 TaxID=3154313 RepID=UPI0034557760
MASTVKTSVKVVNAPVDDVTAVNAAVHGVTAIKSAVHGVAIINSAVHSGALVNSAVHGVTLSVHGGGLVMVVAWSVHLATTVAMAVKPPIQVVTVVKVVHVRPLF